MKKITLTCAHAIVKYLIAQKILINGKKEPLFPGVFGIFGHGNVACLGQALEENQKELPTYRGHHEQNMALTGIGYARAKSCLLYTSPSPRDQRGSRMPSSA